MAIAISKYQNLEKKLTLQKWQRITVSAAENDIFQMIAICFGLSIRFSGEPMSKQKGGVWIY